MDLGGPAPGAPLRGRRRDGRGEKSGQCTIGPPWYIDSRERTPVKRLLALVAGGLGFGALLRRRRRRPLVELGPSPADDLRAKLAETRTASAEEPPAEESVQEEPEASDPSSRRRAVHDEARGAIDELG
jgi:hypothetical protein